MVVIIRLTPIFAASAMPSGRDGSRKFRREVREQDELTKRIVQKLIDKAPEIVRAVMEEDDISREMERLGKAESTA